MDAKTSADPGRADQVVHEFRLLLFQLGEFVGNNEQMGQGFRHLTGAVKPLIAVDIHGAFVGDALYLVEYPLAPGELALDRQ